MWLTRLLIIQIQQQYNKRRLIWTGFKTEFRSNSIYTVRFPNLRLPQPKEKKKRKKEGRLKTNNAFRTQYEDSNLNLNVSRLYVYSIMFILLILHKKKEYFMLQFLDTQDLDLRRERFLYR